MLSQSITSHLSKLCLSLGIVLLVNIDDSQAKPITGNSQLQTIQSLRRVLSQNDPEGVETETETDMEENPNTEDTNTNTDTNTDNNGDVIIDDTPSTQPTTEPEDTNTEDTNEDKPTTEPEDTNTEDTPPATTEDDKQSRFGCENMNGEYTVMYYPSSQPGQSYPWAIPSQLGGGWTPEKRCAEIARRLEFYRPDGLLELSNSRENGYNIVCVTTEKDPDCRIVLTVLPGQDPKDTRDRVFQNIITADTGDTTTGVPTYTGGNSNSTINKIGKEIGIDLSSVGIGKTRTADSIDLKPFLDRNDGGTGEKLDRPSQNDSKKLNPNNFR